MEIRYLMSGQAHCPYLIVSLSTLRKYYDGPVIVYAYPESFETVRRIADDKQLDIEARLWQPEYRGKNSQFLEKIRLMQQGVGNACYLDADTIICDRLDDLFSAADEYDLLTTQFGDWVTTGKIISNRVRRLRQFPNIDQTLVEEVLDNTYPSPNGGIFVCRHGCNVLRQWYEWTWEAKSVFIADETVLQILQLKFDTMKVLLGGRFNCSPKYRPKGLEPAIIHGHGDCFLRPNKSRAGVETWLYLYDHVKTQNFGFVQEWHQKCESEHCIGRGSNRKTFMQLVKDEQENFDWLPPLLGCLKGF